MNEKFTKTENVYIHTLEAPSLRLRCANWFFVFYSTYYNHWNRNECSSRYQHKLYDTGVMPGPSLQLYKWGNRGRERPENILERRKQGTEPAPAPEPRAGATLMFLWLPYSGV